MSKLSELQKDLRKVASSEKAKKSEWFFKTGEGQYGYGDKFIGVTMPEQRVIAKKYLDLNLSDLEKLLKSKIHEERSVALIILVRQFEKEEKIATSSSPPRNDRREQIFEFYLSHSRYVNNWDLVDGSASQIVGTYLLDKKITLLLMYAKSEDLWRKRIAIIATFAFIHQKNPKPTFQVADLLLDDSTDLIQKAVGWMLREVGKRIGQEIEEGYLKTRYKKMGRTALRYAIEHFDREKRQKYLTGKI